MAGCKIQEKQEEGKMFHKLHVFGMNDDLWDRVRGVGRETLCHHLSRISDFR